MTPAQTQALDLIQGLPRKYVTADRMSNWDFDHWLLTLARVYYQEVSEHHDSSQLLAFAKEKNVSIVTIYDHPHDSDESCSAEMLLVDGVPISAWKKIGDRSCYDDGMVMLNETQARALAKEVRNLVCDLESKADEHLDVRAWLFSENFYLTQVEQATMDPIAYGLKSPSWMVGRLSCSTTKFHAINDDNTLEPVKALLSTTKSENPYANDAYHNTLVELQNGETRDVETYLLIMSPRRELPSNG